MAIIEVNHVTKEFKLGHLQSIKVGLQRMRARLGGHPLPEQTAFKALDDVDFKVDAGEILGVIGHNGAGKSTLLRILSRITAPSKGSVRVRGKVSPLIEVSAALVWDLTGRENIYLNGAVLGMTKKEISRKFDEIVAFSELEEFLDTPLKRYSSGMATRLAFSIATSVEADILILDEVLAVGDLAFQRKCFDRMERMIKDRGNTVVFVSHNARQVERVCQRTILLDHGRVVSDGPTTEVCTRYYDLMDQKIHMQAQISGVGETSNRIRSTGQFLLEELRMLDETGTPVEEIVEGATVIVELIGEAKKQLQLPIFAFGIHTTDFIYLTTVRSAAQMKLDTLAPGRFKIRCRINDLPLLPGTYALRLFVSDGLISSTIFHAENISPFRVINASFERNMLPSEGLFSVPFAWSPPEHICTPALRSQRQA